MGLGDHVLLRIGCCLRINIRTLAMLQPVRYGLVQVELTEVKVACDIDGILHELEGCRLAILWELLYQGARVICQIAVRVGAPSVLVPKLIDTA